MIGEDDSDSSDDQEEGNPLSMDFDAQHHIQKQMTDQRLPDFNKNDSVQKFVTAKFMDFDWLFQDGNAKKMIDYGCFPLSTSTETADKLLLRSSVPFGLYKKIPCKNR